MLHKNITLGEVHKIHNWEVANSTARLALSLTDADIGKVAWQLDDDSYWALKDNSPLAWNPIGKDGSPVQSFDFATTTSATGAVGRLKWNDVDGTLDLGLKGGNVTQQIGQEIVKRVYNNTGSTLSDGQVVYVTGASAGRPTVALADADSEATSARTIGVVTESIPNNSEGFITTFGFVRDLNTSAFNEGDALYLSGTPGGLTNIEPIPPQHRVTVGIVARKNAVDGSLFIDVDNGYELDELHDVLINTPTDGQVMSYHAATGLWKNVTIVGTGAKNSFATRLVSTNTTILNTDCTVRADCSSAPVTLQLPTAAPGSGLVFNLKKVDNSSNAMIVQADGVETIDGSITAPVNVQYQTLTIQSNGTSWDII